MPRSCLAVFCSLLTLLPSLAASQGLGEAARKEREKRSSRKPPSRVYGDGDLKAGSPDRAGGEAADSTPTESSADAGPAQPQDGSQPEPSTADPESEIRARNEATWRARARPVRDAVAAAEARVERLKAEADRLERERVIGLMIREYYPGRAAEEARKSVERAEAELIAAQKAWDDFQDEARRAGALPGWLRDR